MEKYESDIDPNVFRQNIKYLEELKYEPLEIDRHESITPKTNKGHLNTESKKAFSRSNGKITKSKKTK